MVPDPSPGDSAREIERLRDRVAELERQTGESARVARRLSARDAVTQVLSDSPSLAAAAPKLLRAVCETLGWQVGTLWNVEAHLGLVRCVELWHSAEVLLPEFESATRGRAFTRGTGLPGRVWAEGRPVWIPDAAADAGLPRAPIAAGEGVGAGLGVPIAVGGGLVGVMEFFSREIREPDHDLLEMFAALGSQIGQFVERKNAEDLLDRFFTLSIDMLCIAGFDGYFKRLNPAWERTLGYRMEDLMAVPFPSFVHPDDYSATIERIRKLRSGEQTISFENRYRASDGTYHWMMWTATPFAERQVIYAAARDITDRKHTEETMQRLTEEAQAASRAKSEFLARMSHEIRTPLNVVIGMGDLLERTSLDTQQHQYVRVFQRAGGNLLALINDILDLARVESGRIALEEIEFELNNLMEGIVEIMSVRSHEKGIGLDYTIAGGTPAFLIGDPERLRQILINLVSNSIKFTAAGSVHIRVAPSADPPRDGALLFSVSDTGIGIPPAKLEVIFDAFAQADASTTRQYGGTGLGLAICRRLVELMGGRIWAQNREGEGATFSFIVPFRLAGAAARRAAEGPPAAGESLARSPRALAGLRILIADDSEENRFLVAEYLKDLGCRLEYAENGEIAVAKGCSGAFDLILMDLQMPVMDGYAATRRIRAWEEEHARLPMAIVALTASALESELQNAMSAGCTAYIRKPVRLSTLLDAIAKYGAPGRLPVSETDRIRIRVNSVLRAAMPEYLDRRRQDAAAILAALESSDFDTIHSLGHKMSGTGTSYGLPRVTDIGLAIERAAEARDAGEIRARAAELAALVERVEIV